MRKTLLVLFASFLFANTHAQTLVADSLKQVLAKERNLEKQFILNKQIAGDLIEKGFPDLVPQYLNRLYSISAQLKNDSLLMMSYMTTSRHLNWKTDSREELEYEYKALKIAEKKYPSMIPSLHSSFASVYNDLLNYDKAVDHCRKGLAILDAQGSVKPAVRVGLYYQLSYAYLYLRKADSALHYAQLANEYWIRTQNTEYIKFASTVIADAYALMGRKKLAEGYYQNSIDLDKPGTSFADAMAAGHYSHYLLKQSKIPEAKYFGVRGLTAAISAQAKLPLLENVSVLKKIHEAARQPDSAYYYANLELAYRDSLFNQERVNAIQDMAFKDEVRQQEEEMKKAEEDVQRKNNLQYAAIALGVVTFVIFFFLLSHSIIANQRLIKFLGILALLIIFEFLNLLLHPYISNLTHHSPVMMLGVMVCIAALLIPLHHKLEHWITHKLVEKNKKIRLTAAKKTIVELEKVNTTSASTNAQQ